MNTTYLRRKGFSLLPPLKRSHRLCFAIQMVPIPAASPYAHSVRSFGRFSNEERVMAHGERERERRRSPGAVSAFSSPSLQRRHLLSFPLI